MKTPGLDDALRSCLRVTFEFATAALAAVAAIIAFVAAIRRRTH